MNKHTLKGLLTHLNFYRLQRSCGKVIFSQASVSHSVHRGGACMAGGMHGGGACMAGACVVGGCMAGGMCGSGACMACMPPRFQEIQSMSGQYASYWNAFLLTLQRHVWGSGLNNIFCCPVQGKDCHH